MSGTLLGAGAQGDRPSEVSSPCCDLVHFVSEETKGQSKAQIPSAPSCQPNRPRPPASPFFHSWESYSHPPVPSRSLLNPSVASLPGFSHATGERSQGMTMIYLSGEQTGICQERLRLICIFSIYGSSVQVGELGYEHSWIYLFSLSSPSRLYGPYRWWSTLLKVPRTQGYKVPNAKGRRKNRNSWNWNSKESDLCLRCHASWIKCCWWHNYQIDAFPPWKPSWENMTWVCSSYTLAPIQNQWGWDFAAGTAYDGVGKNNQDDGREAKI